mmetsp:Transcript_5738/g.19528  ORF Transcript_5738/g.19528 Transcript_5738/m.19528 type:complete len:330 (-) Transcript_5738:108-1097(-)
MTRPSSSCPIDVSSALASAPLEGTPTTSKRTLPQRTPPPPLPMACPLGAAATALRKELPKRCAKTAARCPAVRGAGPVCVSVRPPKRTARRMGDCTGGGGPLPTAARGTTSRPSAARAGPSAGVRAAAGVGLRGGVGLARTPSLCATEWITLRLGGGADVLRTAVAIVRIHRRSVSSVGAASSAHTNWLSLDAGPGPVPASGPSLGEEGNPAVSSGPVALRAPTEKRYDVGLVSLKSMDDSVSTRAWTGTSASAESKTYIIAVPARVRRPRPASVSCSPAPGPAPAREGSTVVSTTRPSAQNRSWPTSRRPWRSTASRRCTWGTWLQPT